MEWGRPGEAEQVADAPVQTVHLVDDGMEMLSGGRRLRMPLHQLCGGTQAGEGIAQPMRDRGRHFADGGQLL